MIIRVQLVLFIIWPWTWASFNKNTIQINTIHGFNQVMWRINECVSLMQQCVQFFYEMTLKRITVTKITQKALIYIVVFSIFWYRVLSCPIYLITKLCYFIYILWSNQSMSLILITHEWLMQEEEACTKINRCGNWKKMPIYKAYFLLEVLITKK